MDHRRVAPGPTKPPLSPTGLFCLLREGENEAESSVDNVGSADYGGSVSTPVATSRRGPLGVLI